MTGAVPDCSAITGGAPAGRVTESVCGWICFEVLAVREYVDSEQCESDCTVHMKTVRVLSSEQIYPRLALHLGDPYCCLDLAFSITSGRGTRCGVTSATTTSREDARPRQDASPPRGLHGEATLRAVEFVTHWKW